MWKTKRKLLSQNFLRDKSLVSGLIDRSSIGKEDIVVEIGPGRGIITEELLKRARVVVGIELDTRLNSVLLNKFSNYPNFILYGESFLDSSFPLTPFKIFSNLPFSIEGEAVRKLIDSDTPPIDSYLVVRKEFAYRLGGIIKESMFSIMHKPWFDFSIYHNFNASDFIPKPKINAVMFRFVMRPNPELPIKEKLHYQNFVKSGFGQGQPVFKNLTLTFGKKLTEEIFYRIKIARFERPLGLRTEQWISLYENFRKRTTTY